MALTVVAAIALAGCEELQRTGDAGAQSGGAQASAGVVRVEERDVERPDIFSMRSQGLWDGRFSLGGRWVAVKQDVESERVLITNLDNDSQIEGALFRREVDLPGPPIMVSMDAAAALGMQPGSPAQMTVVAIRRETVELAPPPAAEPEAAPEDETETDTAAADAATDPAADESGAAEEIAAAAVAAVAAAPAAAAVETAAPPAPVDTSKMPILNQIRKARASGAAAPAPAPTATISGPPKRPFLQVASGTNKEGADAALRRLKNAGIPGEVRTGGTEAAPSYRVVAGPFTDAASYNAAVAQLGELGYADAFPIN